MEYGQEKTGTKTGVLLPQATVSLKLPKAGRDKDRSSHRGFKGAWSCQHFDFGILASRTVGTDLLFKPTSVWLFVTTPLGH